MYFTGFADEAGAELSVQIKATKALGWQNIEMRNVKVDASAGLPSVPVPDGALWPVSGANLIDLPDTVFDYVVRVTQEAGIKINCFGSGLGKTGIDTPFEAEWEQARRAASRMPRMNSKLIRVMSYQLPDDDTEKEAEGFRRLNAMQKLFADAGVQMVHENCTGFGGKSANRTLRLLEAVPGLKLVFDTGNPTREPDHDRPANENGVLPRQSAWEFYQKVKPFVAYVHVKDGVYDVETGKHDWVMAGDGQGEVRRIITDLLQSGYDGGFSIEPHLPPVRAHEPNVEAHEARYRNYVDYGRRLMQIVDEARA